MNNPPQVANANAQAFLDNASGPPNNVARTRAGQAQKRLVVATAANAAGIVTTTELGDMAAFATSESLMALPNATNNPNLAVAVAQLAVVINTVANNANQQFNQINARMATT
jgi:galactose mutarotase-like enzyme